LKIHSANRKQGPAALTNNTQDNYLQNIDNLVTVVGLALTAKNIKYFFHEKEAFENLKTYRDPHFCLDLLMQCTVCQQKSNPSCELVPLIVILKLTRDLAIFSCLTWRTPSFS
jgi:hypothetical protein